MSFDVNDYDWVLISYRGTAVLHAPDLTAAERHLLEAEALLDGGRARCGRRSAYTRIPGIFTRLSAKRCERCCTILNYPQGTGSPKNDPVCRVALGLPADGGPAGDQLSARRSRSTSSSV